MQAVAAISYFHRKIGPMVYYAYPAMALNEEQKTRLADIMDQPYEDGFFTQKFGDLTSINYYFEITSNWARGGKEMLMISFVFNITPTPEIEDLLKKYCIDFIDKLKGHALIYKSFYDVEDKHVEKGDIPKIREFRKKIEFWVQELYWTGIESLRARTEEEKWASIMARPEIFKVIQKLSKGPLSMEDLKKWFNSLYPQYELSKILANLEEQKFVFVNTIGQETFVLLVKEVNIMRIPPDYIIDLEEYSPELSDLTEIYINEIQDFFEVYNPTPMDSLILFSLFANPKIYNVISQLREGPLPKEKILSMVAQESLNDLLKNMELLEQYNIIQNFFYRDVNLYFLKTNVVLTANFPEYLKRLLPKKSKDYRARQSISKRINMKDKTHDELPFKDLPKNIDILSIIDQKGTDSPEQWTSVKNENNFVEVSTDLNDQHQHQDFINEKKENKKYIVNLQEELLKNLEKS